MLKIREEQALAFRRHALRRFEERMVIHLGTLFPNERLAIGETNLSALVREGIDRAGREGITMEFEVCLFLYLMLMLGNAFLETPEYAWARAILDKSDDGSESPIEQIFDTVMSKQGASHAVALEK